MKKNWMNKNQAGVTLLETAVVLMVITTIMAGVWVYIGQSRNLQLVTTAKQQHEMLVQRVRDHYRAYAGIIIPSGETAVRNEDLIDAGVPPAEMVRATTDDTIDHAWGPRRPNDDAMSSTPAGMLNWTEMGNSGVVIFASQGQDTETLPTCATACFFFGVHYRGVPYDACIKLATQLVTGPAADGLVYAEINNNDDDPMKNQSKGDLVPPTSVQVDNLCRTGTADGSGSATFIDTGADLTFIYRLRPSTS